MVILGIIFIVVGGQMVLNAFKRRKLASPDLCCKTDYNEPLSVVGCAICAVFGLAGIALGLNHVIRYR